MLITVLDFVARSKRSKIARHDRLDSVCPRTIFFPTDDPFNSFSRVVRSSLLLLLFFFPFCVFCICVSFVLVKMLQLQRFKYLFYLILRNTRCRKMTVAGLKYKKRFYTLSKQFICGLRHFSL